MSRDAEKSCCCGGSSVEKPPVYHHLGVPTSKVRPNEKYLEGSKLYVTDPSDDPFRIEWCRWLPDSPADKRLQTIPHIAFEVENLDKELAKYAPSQIFLQPFEPFEGIRVAFIDHEDFLVELMQITKKEGEWACS